MEEEVLRVDGLTRRYGRRLALDGVTFAVRRGDVFGFLGPNGAGKTTAIRIILGLVRADSGTVTLFSERGRRASIAARTRIGAMVEIPRFYNHLSGRRNLEVLGLLAGLTDRDRIDGVLGEVGLAPAADDAVGTYSQGMRQRLGIAQALLAEPDLVLLDEPTNGLDPHGVHEMRRLIGRLNRERGTTFLISSHDLNELEQVAGRVAILRQGRLVVTGAVAEILAGETGALLAEVDDPARAVAALSPDLAAGPDTRPDTVRVRAGPEAAPRVAERLVRAGIALRGLRHERATLEDYFLRVTEGEGADLGR